MMEEQLIIQMLTLEKFKMKNHQTIKFSEFSFLELLYSCNIPKSNPY